MPKSNILGVLGDKNYTNNNIEKIVLEMRDPANNHFKYYHLSQRKEDLDKRPMDPFYEGGKQHAGWIFTVAWGRIGASPQFKKYTEENCLTMWDQMTKKVDKGYRVMTYQTFGDHSSAYAEFMRLVGSDSDLFD